MGLEFVINVNIGRKEFHANDVVPEVSEMPKISADHVNVMGMAMKRWEFVIFKPVNAFANTILKGQIVPNAVRIFMVPHRMLANASSNANHVAC